MDLSGLSKGARTLIEDADSGRISRLLFVRLLLTKIGYLGDAVPSRYSTGGEATVEDLYVLPIVANQAVGALSAEDQAKVLADVDAYTHPSGSSG